MPRRLNKEGHKTRFGEKFTGTKISRILKDPYYCGRLEDGFHRISFKDIRISPCAFDFF